MSHLFTKDGIDMPEADIWMASNRYLKGLRHQSAAQELQDVLSLRIPYLYRCAFRLRGGEYG